MAEPTPPGSSRDRCGAATARPVAAVGGTARVRICALNGERRWFRSGSDAQE
jgi:hypothetical protein